VVRLGLDACYAHPTGRQVDLTEQMLAALAEFFETPGAARSRAPDYVREHGLNLEEFRAFGRHLDISRILNKHGVARPLALFRDCLADRGEMAKVFEATTRRAEGARPPLDQDGWRAVLRDLQRLQKLIPVVPIQDVFFRSAAFRDLQACAHTVSYYAFRMARMFSFLLPYFFRRSDNVFCTVLNKLNELNNVVSCG
jgi:hypothetical protein